MNGESCGEGLARVGQVVVSDDDEVAREVDSQGMN